MAPFQRVEDFATYQVYKPSSHEIETKRDECSVTLSAHEFASLAILLMLACFQGFTPQNAFIKRPSGQHVANDGFALLRSVGDQSLTPSRELRRTHFLRHASTSELHKFSRASAP
jgi:hypothetical protein